MNKIILDNESSSDITLKEDTILEFNFNDIQKNIVINLDDGVNLTVYDKSNYTRNSICYNTFNNNNVVINKASIDCSDNVMVNINGENTNIEFYNSIINYKDNEYKEVINHISKNSNSLVVNHCVNVNDNMFKFIVDGKIGKDASKTNFKQDNKIINMNSGKSFILPNLIVDNNDIDASHSAYIGKFDEDILFYMMSRGISYTDANYLLIKAFLINGMSSNEKMRDYLENLIKNI